MSASSADGALVVVARHRHYKRSPQVALPGAAAIHSTPSFGESTSSGGWSTSSMRGNPRQGSPAYTISPDALVGSNNALAGHVTSDAPE